MCGINGFNWADQELVKKMNIRLKHRGPDGDGFFTGENVSFGHARLAIIDLSDKAKQPMKSQNGRFTIVYNGEIYNFAEIKDELLSLDYQFNSTSDTEVLINAWQAWGPECLKKLNGIFAFAVYDQETKNIFLARDRLGVKPLYYYFKNNQFIFSSEIKGILEHQIKREVNLEALNHYFRLMYVPAPLTMFCDIFKLEPGHYLAFDGQEVRINKYWQLDFTNAGDIKKENKAKEAIKDLMASSVKYQQIADRPIGVFLSGGIDSTSVLGNFKRFTSGKIKTFSVGFNVNDPEGKINKDFELARETAKHYSTDHEELVITGQDYLNNLEKVAYHLDEPIANIAQTATFLLAEKAKQSVAVALGGDGGDELFGGYERYALSRFVSRYHKLAPKFLRNLVNIMVGVIDHTGIASKVSSLAGYERYSQFMCQPEESVSRLISQKINQPEVTGNLFKNKFFKAINKKDFEKQFMATDIGSWLVDESLMRTDKTTMAFGLEYRVPVLDHRLVELAMKIPTRLKIKGRHGKIIFKKAMAEFLPGHVTESAKKKVWLPPASEWLRTDLKDFAKQVFSPDYADTSRFLDLNEVNKMFDEHCKKQAYHLDLLWAVLVFQMWYRQYFTGKEPLISGV